MKVAIYPRVSTQEQAKEGYSIGEQIERMEKYCDAMGWTVYNTYTDPGYSGGDTNRPGLQRMIKDVKAGKIDKVLVYKLDRLSRSQLDTLYLIEKVFLANNCDFVSMSENFDTGTPFGRAMIGILAVFAQLEREQIKERMKMGREARAKSGKYGGGSICPIGYDYINGELIKNDYEAMQVQLAFDLAEKGLSPYSIAKELCKKGFSHRKGKWSDQTVRAILHAKWYIGYIKYDKAWYTGTHEAFIDQSKFYEVQKIMDERSKQHKEYNRRLGKATTYLGGFLVCKQCGAKYSKNPVKQKRKDGSVWEYNKFSCNSRSKRRDYLVKDPNCKNKHWPIDELTEMVFNEIRSLALEPEAIGSVSSVSNDNGLKLITAEIEKIEKQISNFMDLFSLDKMPVNVLQDKIHELNDRKTALENELEEVKMKNKTKADRTEAIEALQSFDEILKRGNLDEVRAVIATLIERIDIDGDNVDIHWNFI